MKLADLNNLERLAQAASPGPWSGGSNEPWRDTQGAYVRDIFGNVVVSFGDPFLDNAAANSAYVAAVNPQVVLEMIALIRAYDESLMAIKDKVYAMRAELRKED